MATCGHFNFTVRDNWILCRDCEKGISTSHPKGQRMLERKRRIDNGLSRQQDQIFRQLQASYRQLVEKAGTTDPEVLAQYANQDHTTSHASTRFDRLTDRLSNHEKGNSIKISKGGE